MRAAKKAPSRGGEKQHLRYVLFALSIVATVVSLYFILDFQASSDAKLSGDLILGQVDSASYEYHDSPIIGFFFEYCGVLSYPLCCLIAYLGYWIFLKPVDIWHINFYRVGLRWLGINLLVLGLAALGSRFIDLGSTGGGGLLGDMLNMFCNYALPSFLSLAVYIIVTYCGLSFFFGRSPLFFFDRIGSGFFKFMPKKKGEAIEENSAVEEEKATTSPEQKPTSPFARTFSSALHRSTPNTSVRNEPVFDSSDVAQKQNESSDGTQDSKLQPVFKEAEAPDFEDDGIKSDRRASLGFANSSAPAFAQEHEEKGETQCVDFFSKAQSRMAPAAAVGLTAATATAALASEAEAGEQNVYTSAQDEQEKEYESFTALDNESLDQTQTFESPYNNLALGDLPLERQMAETQDQDNTLSQNDAENIALEQPQPQDMVFPYSNSLSYDAVEPASHADPYAGQQQAPAFPPSEQNQGFYAENTYQNPAPDVQDAYAAQNEAPEFKSDNGFGGSIFDTQKSPLAQPESRSSLLEEEEDIGEINLVQTPLSVASTIQSAPEVASAVVPGETVPETQQEETFEATSAPEEEQSPYITPGVSRPVAIDPAPVEEKSPYITPGVERDVPFEKEESAPVAEADNEPVHTIIQKVDPAVFKAQQEKIRAERLAAAEKARAEAEAKAKAEEEAKAQQEAEALAEQERLQAEAEAKAVAEQERQAQAEAALREQAPVEEEVSPYVGTYAASRQHSPLEQSTSEGAETVKSATAAPSSSETMEDEQPHTIIQKVDPAVFEAQQAQIRAERAAAAAAAERRLVEEQAAAEAAEEEARLAAEAARARAEEERLAQEEAAYAAENYEMPELSADAQATSDALASEFQNMQGEENMSISSLVSRAREQSAGYPREDSEIEAPKQSETPSTIISRGSTAPKARDLFERDSGRTSIIRSTSHSGSNGLADSGADDSFARYAMTKANEQSGISGAVAVDMFDDSIPEARHGFSFDAAAEQKEEEELDASFVGGNSHPVPEEPQRTKNFNFADIAREKGGEDAVSRVPGADNIISFGSFEKDKPKSYEIEHLSSSFIPVGGDARKEEPMLKTSQFAQDSGSFDSTSGSFDHDNHDELSTEEQQQARALREKMKAFGLTSFAEEEHTQESAAPVTEHVAPAPEAHIEESVKKEKEPDVDQDDEVEETEENWQNQQLPQQNAMGQMTPNAMPQYVQLPNGQFVPMMPQTMSMYPSMQMQNMPQYIQLPNGQYVTVQMYQQMYQQNMMATQMAQMQQMQMQQAQMAQMAQFQQSGATVGQMPQPAVQPTEVEPSGFTDPRYGAPATEGYSTAQPETIREEASYVEPVPVAAPAQPEPVQQAPVAQEVAPEIPQYSDVTLTKEPDAHTMGEHGARGVGLPTAGNAFGGAHNSSSSHLPSYMAGVTQGSAASFDQPQSLSLCSVPRHHYDTWRPDQNILAVSHETVEITEEELNHTAERINEVLHSYGIKASVADYLTGPVITRFDLDLAPGVKSSAIVSIETELCRNLLVPNVRVVPIIEGSSYVGLEVPNAKRQFITLGDMVSSREFQESKASLPMVLGASVVGKPVVKDLAETPHLLVAGTTGSGKSAGLNTILISLLLKCSPAELRLILVDPKQLEFSIYRDLPHLITPVITDVAEQTPIALHWCVEEMERRFKLMSMLGVRKLAEYNKMVRDAAASGRSIPDPLWTVEMGPHPQALQPLPWIVIVVEEFADLMAQSSRKKDKDKTAEGYIARLTAKSRAAGIHLVLVTQTPRSEVVNGMIKANIPSRIAFTVQNRIDSNIVLDEKGAECLLGNGDMLYKFSGSSMATRAHGAFTSNDDVKNIVSAWRNTAAPEYLEDVIAVPPDEDADAEGEGEIVEQKLDVKFDAAAAIAREYLDRRNKPPSITDLQNDLGVGFPRAKKIYKQLIKEGVLEE